MDDDLTDDLSYDLSCDLSDVGVQAESVPERVLNFIDGQCGFPVLVTPNRGICETVANAEERVYGREFLEVYSVELERLCDEMDRRAKEEWESKHGETWSEEGERRFEMAVAEDVAEAEREWIESCECYDPGFEDDEDDDEQFDRAPDEVMEFEENWIQTDRD